MESLRVHFPEIYDLHKKGVIVLREMFDYETPEGEKKVHISYYYR